MVDILRYEILIGNNILQLWKIDIYWVCKEVDGKDVLQIGETYILIQSKSIQS